MKIRRNVSRRDFLRAASAVVAGELLLGGNCLSGAAAQSQVVRVRPNVATLDPGGTEIAALKAGVDAMKQLPATNPKSWVTQARIHNDFCPHGNWFFLPWHRAYLYYFEQICREASGSAEFVLPYWDWSATPSIPAAFWGDGNPLADGSRQVTEASVARAEFVGPDVIARLMRITDFTIFGSGPAAAQRQPREPGAGELEGIPHNYMHNFIRGNMRSLMSPLDPVFWLHHANVDRLWAEWQQINLGRLPREVGWLDHQLARFFDLQGAPVTMSVRATLSTHQLGYSYPSPPAAPPPAPAPAAFFSEAPSELRAQKVLTQTATQTGPVSAKLNFPGALQQRVVGLAKASLYTAALDPTAVPIGEKELPGVESTVRLTVEVDTPQDPLTAVRVFLNTPSPSVATSIEDPGYVGTFTFFGNGGGHAGGGAPSGGHSDERTFRFDATETILKLARAGRYREESSASITLVPISLEPGGAAQATVEAKRFSLETVMP